jgi:hypothetical protein
VGRQPASSVASGDGCGEEMEVLRTSACWFIACLAQANKVEEHCAMLRDGGELLTTLWILSSDLGGGAQY